MAQRQRPKALPAERECASPRPGLSAKAMQGEAERRRWGSLGFGAQHLVVGFLVCSTSYPIGIASSVETHHISPAASIEQRVPATASFVEVRSESHEAADAPPRRRRWPERRPSSRSPPKTENADIKRCTQAEAVTLLTPMAAASVCSLP